MPWSIARSRPPSTFLVETGTYCIQTQRAVRFTREEVSETVAAAPRQVVMGKGDDATLCAGLDRAAGGSICRVLSERLADQEREPGRPIGACNDLESGQPMPDYAEKLRQLRDDLSGMGLTFA